MNSLPMLKLPESKVRLIRSLHIPSQREKKRQFIVEGLRACREAKAGFLLITNLLSQEKAGKELTKLALIKEMKIYSCEEKLFRELSATDNPQGCMVVAPMPAQIDVAQWTPSSETSLILILVEVTDPGNAGTLMRSAWAFGAELIVFTKGSVEIFNPKVVRSAMGAHFHVNYACDQELSILIYQLQSKNFKHFMTASREGKTLSKIEWAQRSAIILGNEAWGIRNIEFQPNEIVSIPIREDVDSLNVAVAGSILLFNAAVALRLLPDH